MSLTRRGARIRLIVYAAGCAVALSYLAAANAQGYVPFAARVSRASQHTANVFHK